MPKAKKKLSKIKKKLPKAKKLLTAKKPKPKSKAKIVKKAKAKKKKVLTTPKGYHSITPYLIVKNAAKAIEFYKKAFDAKEVMRMGHEEGKIGHAELIIGDSKIMLADEYPEMDACSPDVYGGTPVGIHLYVKNVDLTLERAEAMGGTLLRPAEDMFYGDRSGALLDPFGHKWYVSTHVEDVSPAQLKKREAELFGDME